MIVLIDKRFYIEIDDRNYVLKEKYEGKDVNKNIKEYERIEGYFINMEHALNRIIEIKISEQEEVKDIEEYLKNLKKLTKELDQKIKEGVKCIKKECLD